MFKFPRNVVYQAPGRELTEEMNLACQFTVYDAHHAASSPVEFHIHVRLAKPSPLQVMILERLLVMEGEATPITEDNIVVS